MRLRTAVLALALLPLAGCAPAVAAPATENPVPLMCSAAKYTRQNSTAIPTATRPMNIQHAAGRRRERRGPAAAAATDTGCPRYRR